jgi:hypothetical protein
VGQNRNLLKPEKHRFLCGGGLVALPNQKEASSSASFDDI